LVEDNGRELGKPSDEEQATDEWSGEYEAVSSGVGLKPTRQVLSAAGETTSHNTRDASAASNRSTSMRWAEPLRA
jgi:hypothetical protein